MIITSVNWKTRKEIKDIKGKKSMKTLLNFVLTKIIIIICSLISQIVVLFFEILLTG